MSSLAFRVRCPKCPDILQGTSTPIKHLKQLLEAGGDITVIGMQCKHVFKLSDGEIKELRKAVALLETKDATNTRI